MLNTKIMNSEVDPIFQDVEETPMFKEKLAFVDQNVDGLKERIAKFNGQLQQYTNDIQNMAKNQEMFSKALFEFCTSEPYSEANSLGGANMVQSSQAYQELANFGELLGAQLDHIGDSRVTQSWLDGYLNNVKQEKKRYEKKSQQFENQLMNNKVKAKDQHEAQMGLQEIKQELNKQRFQLATLCTEVETRKKYDFLEIIVSIFDAHQQYYQRASALMTSMEPWVTNILEIVQIQKQQERVKQKFTENQILSFKEKEGERMKRRMSSQAINQKEHNDSRNNLNISASNSQNQNYNQGPYQMNSEGMQKAAQIQQLIQQTVDSQGKMITNLKKGYLLKRSGTGSARRSTWLRRFFVLDSQGILYYYGVTKDNLLQNFFNKEEQPKNTVNLLTSTIKMNGEDNMPHCFRIVSPERTYLLQAEDDFERQEWVESLQQVIACLLNGALAGATYQAQKPQHVVSTQRSIFDKIINSSHNANNSIHDNLNLDDSFGRQLGLSQRLDSMKKSSSFHDLSGPDQANKGSANQKNWQYLHGKGGQKNHGNHMQALDRVRQISGNQYCADCNSKDPDWASLNLGVLFCIECSGAHRKLGVHVSKVRSLTLDVKVWDHDILDFFDRLGNVLVNQVYEAQLQPRHKRSVSGRQEQFNHNNQLIINSNENWVWDQDSSDSDDHNDSFIDKMKGDTSNTNNNNNKYNHGNVGISENVEQEREPGLLEMIKPQPDSHASKKEEYIKSKYMDKLFVRPLDLSVEELQASFWGSVQVNNMQQCVYYVAKGIDVNYLYNHFLAQQLNERVNGFQSEGHRKSFSRSVKHIANNLRVSMHESSSSQLSPIHPAQEGPSNQPNIALLHLASTDDAYITIMELLVQNSGQINVQDQMGRTPLHYCMLFDNFQGAKYLIRRGANTQITDKNGRDPIKLRMLKGSLPDEELFEMLSGQN